MRVLVVQALALALAAPAAAAPLAVVAATPALGSLVEAVGGPDVRVVVLARPGANPHRVDATPAFVQAAAAADLLVVNGLDLDARWLPAVLEQSGNPRIQPGAPGYLVGAAAVVPLQVPSETAMGARASEEHPLGNPHYLLDPMNGLRVAALLRDRLGELRPERRDAFLRRYAEFRMRVGVAMLGQAVVDRFPEFETLVGLAEHGRLAQFLANQHLGEDEQPAALGGWLGAMAPHRGVRAVGDHDRWVYFAQRFGLEMVANLEPRPGVPPGAPRVAELAKLMRAMGVRLILAARSGDARDVRLLAERSGAAVAWLDDAAEERDYLAMIDDDVRRVVGALPKPTTTTTTRPTPQESTTSTTEPPPT